MPDALDLLNEIENRILGSLRSFMAYTQVQAKHLDLPPMLTYYLLHRLWTTGELIEMLHTESEWQQQGFQILPECFADGVLLPRPQDGEEVEYFSESAVDGRPVTRCHFPWQKLDQIFLDWEAPKFLASEQVNSVSIRDQTIHFNPRIGTQFERLAIRALADFYLPESIRRDLDEEECVHIAEYIAFLVMGELADETAQDRSQFELKPFYELLVDCPFYAGYRLQTTAEAAWKFAQEIRKREMLT